LFCFSDENYIDVIGFDIPDAAKEGKNQLFKMTKLGCQNRRYHPIQTKSMKNFRIIERCRDFKRGIFCRSKCGKKGEMILSIYLFLPIQPGYTHSKEVNEVEQQTMLKEILKAFDLHASDIRSQIADLNEKFQSLDKKVQSLDHKVQSLDHKVQSLFRKKFAEMDKRMQALEDRLESRIDRLENEMNERFDRLETKINNIRMELIETQETVDFHSVKIAQHDRKIRNLSQQQ